MKLSANDCESIKIKAVNMFQKYNIRHIPIDCFEICNKMNVELVPYTTLGSNGFTAAFEFNKDGFCLQSGNTKEWKIYYNDTMGKKRIRFTIMHEIGHIVLDHIEYSELAEAEANFFAKYSLAPPPLIHKIQPHDYSDLVDAFEISRECALYAMQYYKNWLNYGGNQYKEYELRLISLFNQEISPEVM